MQSIFVAFCSFYKPECVFDSFANMKRIVQREMKLLGFQTLSHENRLRIRFAELFSLCRGFVFKRVFLIIYDNNDNIKNL